MRRDTRAWGVWGLATAAILVSAVEARADSAADLLMKSVDKNSPGAAAAATPQDMRSMGLGEVRLNNPFAMQLFSQWQTAEKMPYHVNMWVQKVLREDFRGAAHLWGQVQKDFTPAFAPIGKLTQTYLYWRLNLGQAFMDSWLEQLALKSVRDSKAMDALVQTVQPGFSNWLMDQGVVLSATQSGLILGDLKDERSSPVFDSLRAWALIRSKQVTEPFAIQTLERLTNDDPLKIPLAKAVALGFARTGDLGRTGQILKLHLEPAIQKKGDPAELASYYLQIARLLYQAEALDAAEVYYRKIPNGRPEFLTAREELSWVLLRKNETSKLRGELKNFQLGLFDDNFLPEALVVSAISNLKQCYYGKVESDFQNFIRLQRTWADKIESELKAESPKNPGVTDGFISMALRGQAKRAQELKEIQELGRESITAVIPAVGVQAHWTEAEGRQKSAMEASDKFLNHEYRRVWKNRGEALREAIRKMKFVKVELLSQVSQMAKKEDTRPNPDWDKLKQASLKDEKDSIMFPFDGVVWNDELFRLRSVSESVCL